MLVLVVTAVLCKISWWTHSDAAGANFELASPTPSPASHEQQGGSRYPPIFTPIAGPSTLHPKTGNPSFLRFARLGIIAEGDKESGFSAVCKFALKGRHETKAEARGKHQVPHSSIPRTLHSLRNLNHSPTSKHQLGLL